MRIPGLDEAFDSLYTFQDTMQELLERMAGGIETISTNIKSINDKLDTLIEQGRSTNGYSNPDTH